METSHSTVDYIKEAQQAGFTREQAEFQASKYEKLKEEFFTKKELVTLYESMKKDLQVLQYQIIFKLGGIVVASTSILSYIIKH